MVDGCVAIPAEPGWGVGMSEDWLANAEHRCTELDTG
jgi:hypothetical protein